MPNPVSQTATLKKSVLKKEVSRPGCLSFSQVSWYATFLGRKESVVPPQSSSKLPVIARDQAVTGDAAETESPSEPASWSPPDKCEIVGYAGFQTVTSTSEKHVFNFLLL